MVAAWGDVPTWLLVIVGVVGGGAALWQLRLQRIQLHDQQEVIADQTRIQERQQAEQAGLSWRPAEPIRPGGEYQHVWMAVVENRSPRPIRNVVCRIKPSPQTPGEHGGYEWEAEAVAQLVPTRMPPGTEIFLDPDASGHVRVIASGRQYGFKFPIPTEGHEHAEFKVRFTDDADLLWEIDNDLHLQRLDSPDW
jgi:hypothetical protein